jgi:hypothetical protein
VAQLLEKKNGWLAERQRAQVPVAGREVAAKIAQLTVGARLKVQATGRALPLEEDVQALAEESPLVGCYVIKSDLPKPLADAQALHNRDEDLALMEVVTLAYLMVGHLRQASAKLDVTVEEGLGQLTSLCATQILVKGEVRCNQLPMTWDLSQKLLRAADIHLLRALPHLAHT